jgi:hypothetical protein
LPAACPCSCLQQSADPVIHRLLPNADSVAVGLRFSLGTLPSFNCIHAMPVPSHTAAPVEPPPHRNVVVILGQSVVVIADPPQSGMDDTTTALSVSPIHHTTVRRSEREPGVRGRKHRCAALRALAAVL